MEVAMSPACRGFESHPLHHYKQNVWGSVRVTLWFLRLKFAFSKDFSAVKLGDIFKAGFN
jgi:hypothetical protein